MNLKNTRDLKIAKDKIDFANNKNENLNYPNWVEFIDNHLNFFIWEEDTEKGKEVLKNIDKVPEWAREGRLTSLKKRNAFADFDKKKGYYNINTGFSSENNWISIGFERTPTIEELKIFVEMARHLDALLLKDGKEIIDEKVIESLI